MNDTAHNFSQELFVERLRALMSATGASGQRLAQCAEITKQTFSGYLNAGRMPSIAVLARWVREVGLNPTWLLVGEGPMLRKADTEGTDPVTQRVGQVMRTMREAGVDELRALEAARDMLDGEIKKLAKARGGYGVAEPVSGQAKAAEEAAQYAAMEKAAGDDSA